MKTDEEVAKERNGAFLARCWQDGEYYTETESFFYETAGLNFITLRGPKTLVARHSKCTPVRFMVDHLLVCHTHPHNGQHSYAWIHA